MHTLKDLWRTVLTCLMLTACWLGVPAAVAAQPATKILFLGDRNHHRPRERFELIAPFMKQHGIDITYSDEVTELNPDNLKKYQGLIVYANIDQIEPREEKALLDFVAAGGGFVPLHCASYCFRNSADYVALVGAQFKEHGTGIFRTTIVQPEHPVMKGFGGFESWDETYVHDKHNEKDRVVLEVRDDGQRQEPWSWVRTHGKGRVFYTAWGHDERTWKHPGFQNLLERGIRWAVGQDSSTVVAPFALSRPFVVPKMTEIAKDAKPFEYVPAKIAFYPPGGDSKGGGAWNQMQLPLSPEESMKHVSVPEGFELQLFAAEPQIGKPLCMNWDERGRLWIAETIDYPNELQEEGQGRDQIKICEDTDGDGRADKFTIFADKLSIPTSFTFSRGGLIVHQAPQTLFLKDTDGDGKADVRQVLFEGWNTRDTHAGPSNLQYGLDNWLWGMQGYAGFEGQVAGEKLRFGQGFYRFMPDGSKLEFLRSTNNNTWGIGFTEEGLVFGSTANGNPSVYMAIPNRFYEGVRGWSIGQLESIADSYLFRPITDKVRQVDWHGGYTAAAGHAIYTARSYPEEYWNQTAFVAEPTGHLVGVFLLQPNGSDFTSTNPFNLVASDDEWFAPTMAEVGPDGHVWIIDWYNYIVQHNPTPVGYETGKGAAYLTDLRDKKHGRIYRVVYKAAPKDEPISLANSSPEQLVAALRHENMFWRKHAQRLLVERGKQDVVPALIQLVKDKHVDALGLDVGAIHALWTLHGLGAFNGPQGEAVAAAVDALWHLSPGVRRTAARVLPKTKESARAILQARLLEDPSPQVRLAALLTLARTPADAETTREISMLVTNSRVDDPWIRDAVTAAAAPRAAEFLRAMAAANHTLNGASLTVVGIVAEHHARTAQHDIPGLLAALASADVAVIDVMIKGLAEGSPKGHPIELSAGAHQQLIQLIEKLPASSKAKFLHMTRDWGSPELEQYRNSFVESLSETVSDEDKSDEDRVAAARQLIELRKDDAGATEEILSLISPQSSPALAGGIIEACAASETKNTGEQLLERLPALTPATKSKAFATLLRRPAWTVALLSSIEAGQLDPAELAIDQQQALAWHPDRRIRERAKTILAKTGGLPSADRQKVIDELSQAALRQGDVAQGLAIFKDQCAKCHLYQGEGGKIGPDLTGMGSHPKSELLVHILDPHRSVEGNFRQYSIATVDGEVLVGMLVGESQTSVELADVEGKIQTVLREDIEELKASNKSIMPEGFEKQIPPEGLANLLEFLSQHQK